MNSFTVKASDIEKYDPDRFSFAWNEDYSEAVVTPLRWWDLDSYYNYQSQDEGHEDE